jgi:hypothetical protein
MLIVDKVGTISIETVSYSVGQRADRQDIVTTVELQSVLGRQPDTGLNLFQDGFKSRLPDKTFCGHTIKKPGFGTRLRPWNV